MISKLIQTPTSEILLVDGGKDYKCVTLRGGDGKLAIHVYHGNGKLVWADHADKYYYMGHTTELSQDQVKSLVGYDKEADMYYGLMGSICTRLYAEPIDALKGLMVANGLKYNKPYVCLLTKISMSDEEIKKISHSGL